MMAMEATVAGGVGAGTILALVGVVALAGAALIARLAARRLSRARQDVTQRHAALDTRDERLTRREETLEAKSRTLELRDATLLERERQITAAQAEVDDAWTTCAKRLEELADLTADEARQQVLDIAERQARGDALAIVRDIEARARSEGEQRARQIVATAAQRIAVEAAAPVVTTTVVLPDDDVKSRIIGREGRNIRAFERVTGVDLVIDDAPGSVLLSCFDPVRREIARLALLELVEDGRIHPTSIEAATARAKVAVHARTDEAGRAATMEAEVPIGGAGGLSEELLRLLGRLHLRTSYGQNVLQHSVEVAHLAGLMAEEIGADAALARRCGLLHDVGKALTQQVPGTHAAVGALVAGRLGEHAEVCHAIAAHHSEVEPTTVADVLTQAADAISAGRPGARRTSLERYIARLESIEELCRSYDGVSEVHAMQAGRDVRVMVHPDTVDDGRAQALARDIAGRIQAELSYPGQITITVIRELRASSTAE